MLDILNSLWRTWEPPGLPRTQNFYRRVVGQLLEVAAEHHQVDRSVICAFLGAHAERAPRSTPHAIAAIRCFFRHAQRAGAVDHDPAAMVGRRHARRALPRPLSVDEVQRVLDAPLRSTLRGLRDRALLELLYAAGLHAREVAALDVRDARLSLDRFGLGSVRVERRDRELPIGARAVAAITAYLDRRGRCLPLEPLLLDERGDRLGVAHLRRILADHGARALKTLRITPRVMRATFAAHLLDGGADVTVVQVLLGHASVQSTLPYVALAIDHLVRVYDRAHPLARSGPACLRAA